MKNTNESIAGHIERITFHSEESGFCVLRVRVKTMRDPVTVIGHAPNIACGEYVEAAGSWIRHKAHGLQFQAATLKTTAPTTSEGIYKYLSSGMIKGIGPHFAKRLINAFGKDVFDVIENNPDQLLTLDGIGKKRKDSVIEAWSEQKAVRDIMIFLQSHGVGTARAVRIYKTYGDAAISKVCENPYRLSLDIYGIGFKTADELAIKLGIAKDSLIRAEAGIRHILKTIADQGHCGANYDALIKQSIELLDIPEAVIVEAIESQIVAEHIIADTIDEKRCIFLSFLYHAEQGIARHIKRLQAGALPWGSVDVDAAIVFAQNQNHIELSTSQKIAVSNVLKNKVSIITGGPGVGKTTIVNSILKIARKRGAQVSLCSPTGRAAKRLSEVTQLPAKTIHRLLEFSPQIHGFKHDQYNPLETDFVIVDEASMLDVILMNALLRAIPDHTALLLVGDVDQLPSVGAGSVLADMIDSKAILTVKLTEIFRQAGNSKIIVNAHRINQGSMPLYPEAGESSDFYFVESAEIEDIHKKLIHVVTERIPKRFNVNAVDDIQVLTPMNRGGLGAWALNAALQEKLNGHSEPKVKRFGTTFSPGDKVIQRVNNYDKEVFNGDIGRIYGINLEDQIVNINFNGKLIPYDFTEMDEINLAYAITIHKSQGSEYPIIVIPISTQHYVMLVRNLLYTAVTRGKKMVVLIGQKKAVAMAVKNIKSNQRLTKLKEWL